MGFELLRKGYDITKYDSAIHLKTSDIQTVCRNSHTAVLCIVFFGGLKEIVVVFSTLWEKTLPLLCLLEVTSLDLEMFELHL